MCNHNSIFAKANITLVMLPDACRRAFLYDKTHAFHFATVLDARRNDIDARRVDACMSENIRKLGNVLFETVKGAGKKVSEIVREDLRRRNMGACAQPFHFTPNGGSTNGHPVFIYKDGSRA